MSNEDKIHEEIQKESINESKKKSKSKSNDMTWVYVSAIIVIILGIFILYQYTDVFGTKDNSLIDTGNDVDVTAFTYNGYGFVMTSDGQYTTALPQFAFDNGSSYTVAFRNKPTDVENIQIEGNFSGFLPSDKTLISLDVSKVKGNLDILRAVPRIALSLASAFYPIQGNRLMNPTVVCMYDNDESCADTIVATCESNPDDKVIEMYYGEESKIIANGNFIKLFVGDGEMTKVADRLFYSWY